MLSNLLEKSEKERQRAALIITGVIGVIIFSAWLTIAGFDIKQAVITPGQEDRLKKNYLAFQGELPSVRQTESVTTELAKRQQLAGKVSGLSNSEKSEQENADLESGQDQKKKPFLEKLFERLGL